MEGQREHSQTGDSSQSWNKDYGCHWIGNHIRESDT